jgi:hypothetical protein
MSDRSYVDTQVLDVVAAAPNVTQNVALCKHLPGSVRSRAIETETSNSADASGPDANILHRAGRLARNKTA